MHVEWLFYHGWGYSAKDWEGWTKRIPAYCAVQCEDRGYFGKPRRIVVEPKKGIRVVVAHSLGLHFVPNDLWDTVDILATCGSFLCFPSFDYETKWRRILEKMRKRLPEDARAVLRDFRRRSARPSSFDQEWNNNEYTNWEQLQWDLNLLENAKLPDSILSSVNRVHIVHGTKDAIVSVRHSEDIQRHTPHSVLHTIDGGGHDVFRTHADDCLSWLYSEIGLRQCAFKERVAENFSRAAPYYAAYAQVQRQSAQDLALFLPKESFLPTGTIYEIGCGTGFLTKSLAEHFPQRCILATDIAQGMIDYCKNDKTLAVKNVDFVVEDAEAGISTSPSYALIASGMTLQWMYHPLEMIERLHRRLLPGGHLLFSCMVANSFPEWKRLCKECDIPFTGRQLPEEEAVQVCVKALDADATVTTRQYTVSYSSPRAFFDDLKKLGAHATDTDTHLSSEQWRRLLQSWEKTFARSEVTYSILYALVHKAIVK